MSKRKLKIAVFMGGPSGEHEVSLHTGREIIKNLSGAKYEVRPVIVTKKGKWLLPGQSRKLFSFGKKMALAPIDERAGLKKIGLEKPDVVFIAMHGKYGEDGTLQGLLESVGIAYTGSGVLASSLGMDKPRASAVFEKAGLSVPPFMVIKKKTRIPRGVIASAIKNFSFPLVIKPANHGSSVGVTIARNKKEVARGIYDAGRFSDEIILQKFIKGKEITCGVLEKKPGSLMPLPPMEIIPRLGSFYDYRSKYADGGSDHIVAPSWMSKKFVAKIKRAACQAHAAIGCFGMSRADFMFGEDGKLYLLEINTIPGMTHTSLLPQGAQALGITFPKLLDIIVASARTRPRQI